jgi:DNA-binding NarL/FixJ family response regulator
MAMAMAMAGYVGTLAKSIDRTVASGAALDSTCAISTAHHPPLAIRVMIVSEVRLYREGLARALAAQPELEVVEDMSGDMLLKLGGSQPDIILADSAIVRTTELVARAADNGVRVVAFAVAEEDENEVLACAQVGVAGFVARNATMEELLRTLRTASQGDVRCSPRIARLLVRRVAMLTDSGSHPGENLSLSRRQRDVVALIDRGLSNKEIATRLGIEVATVKNHVHYLLKKLQVHRRGEAAAVARGSSTLRTQTNLNP